MNMLLRESPITPANSQKRICPVDAFIRLMPKDKAKTKAKGDNIAIQPNGVVDRYP